MKSEIIRAGDTAIQLVNGDSLAIMDAAAPRSVDCIVTSPPYNLGIKYESYDDTTSREDYLAWSDRWLSAARRVIGFQGSLFLNMGGKPSDPLGPEQVVLRAVEAGWVVQNKLYWIKSITTRVKTKPDHIKAMSEKAGLDAKQVRALARAFAEAEGDGLERSAGHFKSLNSPRFVNDCVEMVYHLTRDGDVPLDRIAVGVEFEDKSNLTRGTRGKNGDRRCRGNAIFVPYVTIQSRDEQRPHPATFPVELASYCYQLHGLGRIKLTMDPFSGIGHSAMAAAQLGLNHVGVEVGPQTHADAVRMVREFVEQHVTRTAHPAMLPAQTR